MAVVKSLAFFSKSKLKNLRSFVNSEFSNQGFTPFPFDMLHYFLPFGLKFLRESYVALYDNNITGLITLEKDEGNRKRLKITQLFLEEDSAECGELLINYVVARFLAQGADSFYVAVDENNDLMLKLLSDVCKFRLVARENIYAIKKNDIREKPDCDFDYVNMLMPQDIGEVVSLYNGCLNSHQKQAFLRQKSRFRGNFVSGIKGVKSFQFVLRNNLSRIFGYFRITSPNNSDFILECVILPSYEGYLSDILEFSFSEISKRSRDWTLYIKLKSCFSNFEKLNQTLELNGYLCQKRNNILTKDLYRPAKAEKPSYAKQIIFSDITPYLTP